MNQTTSSPEEASPASQVPAHINETIVAMTKMHAAQKRAAHPVQKKIAQAISALGRPAVLLILTAIVAGWIGTNLVLMALGHTPPDPPPFAYLEDATSLAALYLATTIVITQRHEDNMATCRDQLTLQLALLADQKSAKIIRLLEELRRNDPDQSSDPDHEAEAMAKPADPEAVMAEIKATHEALAEQ
jgi:uncharacterized membrane protein